MAHFAFVVGCGFTLSGIAFLLMGGGPAGVGLTMIGLMMAVTGLHTLRARKLRRRIEAGLPLWVEEGAAALVFRRNGISYGDGNGAEFFVPWESVKTVELGVHYQKGSALIQLVDARRVQVSGRLTVEQFLASAEECRALCGADIRWRSRRFGPTATEIASAILAYGRNPQMRERLTR